MSEEGLQPFGRLDGITVFQDGHERCDFDKISQKTEVSSGFAREDPLSHQATERIGTGE